MCGKFSIETCIDIKITWLYEAGSEEEKEYRKSFEDYIQRFANYINGDIPFIIVEHLKERGLLVENPKLHLVKK